MAFEELQVPEKDGAWFCARHKNVETWLRCGRCEKPICPRCTVYGPTGARCRSCLSNRGSQMYRVTPSGFLLSFGAATVLGGLGAILLQALGGFWLWILLYAPALGPLLGQLVVKITRGKRGAVLAGVVCLGLAFGTVLAALFTGQILNPFLWLFLVIAMAGVWAWLK